MALAIRCHVNLMNKIMVTVVRECAQLFPIRNTVYVSDKQQCCRSAHCSPLDDYIIDLVNFWHKLNRKLRFISDNYNDIVICGFWDLDNFVIQNCTRPSYMFTVYYYKREFTSWTNHVIQEGPITYNAHIISQYVIYNLFVELYDISLLA